MTPLDTEYEKRLKLCPGDRMSNAVSLASAPSLLPTAKLQEIQYVSRISSRHSGTDCHRQLCNV